MSKQDITTPTPSTGRAPVAKKPESRVAQKPRGAKPTKRSKGPAGQRSQRPPSKQDRLAALLIRDEGATTAQMIAATGWLPHTVRAALTGLRKKGYVDSDKVGEVRTYRGSAPA